jgi:hypothetical protein|tara:strand:- start:723 stop:956 length:234 start_codon:yes stop_codon:yes gene_type:complete
MKSPAPRGKDGHPLGVGDIVDVCWQDGIEGRATILSLEEVLDESEIRIFDSVVLWSTGEKGLASTAGMTMVSKVRSN